MGQDLQQSLRSSLGIPISIRASEVTFKIAEKADFRFSGGGLASERSSMPGAHAAKTSIEPLTPPSTAVPAHRLLDLPRRHRHNVAAGRTSPAAVATSSP